MTLPELPDDLRQLERELMARRKVTPPAALRERVLLSVGGELVRNGRERPAAFALAIAASIALWLNLSWSASMATDFQLQGSIQTERIVALRDQLEQLAPAWDRDELDTRVMVMLTGERLPYSRIIVPREGNWSFNSHNRQVSP